MKNNKEDNLYIVNKFIKARSVKEALEREKDCEITEVYLEADWRKMKIESMINREEGLGFK